MLGDRKYRVYNSVLYVVRICKKYFQTGPFDGSFNELMFMVQQDILLSQKGDKILIVFTKISISKRVTRSSLSVESSSIDHTTMYMLTSHIYRTSAGVSKSSSTIHQINCLLRQFYTPVCRYLNTYSTLSKQRQVGSCTMPFGNMLNMSYTASWRHTDAKLGVFYSAHAWRRYDVVKLS